MFSCSPEGATKLYFLCIIAVLLALHFTLKQCIIINNIYGIYKIRLFLLFGNIYEHFIFWQTATCFLLFIIKLFNTIQMLSGVV